MQYQRPKSAHCIRAPYLSESNHGKVQTAQRVFGLNQNLFREEQSGYFEFNRRQKHHKSQHCVYVNGTAQVDASKTGIGGRLLNYR